MEASIASVEHPYQGLSQESKLNILPSTLINSLSQHSTFQSSQFSATEPQFEIRKMSQLVAPEADGSEALLKLSFDGDVILKPSGGSKPAVRLLCSSACLRHGSPVFKAIFTEDRFAEGEDLSTDSPTEMPLPDDDPVCIKTLCDILHFQDLGRMIVTDLFLADFVIVVDKYDCRPAVGGWVSTWLDSLSHTHNFEKLLFAAYVLDMPDQFRTITRRLLPDSFRPIDVISAMHGMDIVPCTFLQDLEYKRLSICRTMMSAIQPNEMLRAAEDLDCDICVNSQAVARAWFTGLASVGLTFMGQMSPTQIHQRFIRLVRRPVPNMEHGCTYDGPEVCACNVIALTRGIAVADMSSILSTCPGSCLDCARRKTSYGRVDRPCRIFHP